jgi:hypothetical protein
MVDLHDTWPCHRPHLCSVSQTRRVMAAASRLGSTGVSISTRSLSAFKASTNDSLVLKTASSASWVAPDLSGSLQRIVMVDLHDTWDLGCRQFGQINLAFLEEVLFARSGRHDVGRDRRQKTASSASWVAPDLSGSLQRIVMVDLHDTWPCHRLVVRFTDKTSNGGGFKIGINGSVNLNQVIVGLQGWPRISQEVSKGSLWSTCTTPGLATDRIYARHP